MSTTLTASVEVKPCFCVGPQDGQPICPCRMRNVQVKDGRYVETIDYGPVHHLTPEEQGVMRRALFKSVRKVSTSAGEQWVEDDGPVF